VTSFDPDSGAAVTLASSVRSFFVPDHQAKHIVVFAAAPAHWATLLALDGSGTTPLSADCASGRFTPDDSAFLCVDSKGALSWLPIGGGAATLVQAGPLRLVDGISPDGKFAVYEKAKQPHSFTNDLYLTATQAAPPTVPTTLRAQTDALIMGTVFTSDSAFALYNIQVDAAGNGTLVATPTVGSGQARQLAQLSSLYFTLGGSRVLFSDNLVETPLPNQGADGTTDLALVDLASGAAPTMLAQKINMTFWPTADRKSVVFCRRDAADMNGVYMMLLPQ
jgi:hypothetical protein